LYEITDALVPVIQLLLRPLDDSRKAFMFCPCPFSFLAPIL